MRSGPGPISSQELSREGRGQTLRWGPISQGQVVIGADATVLSTVSFRPQLGDTQLERSYLQLGLPKIRGTERADIAWNERFQDAVAGPTDRAAGPLSC